MDDVLAGPFEVAVLEFPGSEFNGEIVPALVELVESGIVAIVDLVVVVREEDGSVEVLEVSALPEVFDGLEGAAGALLSEDDLDAIAGNLSPGSTAAVVVWEDTWAARLRDAIADAGGRVVAHDRLDAETVVEALASATA